MTPRQRASIILALLFALCVAVPTLLAYAAGYDRSREDIDQLEQRVTRLETDVSLLRE